MIPAALSAAIECEIQTLSSAAAQLGAQLTIDSAALFQRDIALHSPSDWSPNGHCQIVQTADGWIAVNLAREDDRAGVPAWLESPLDCKPWDAVAAYAAMRSCDAWVERATLLGLPVSRLGESEPLEMAVMPDSGLQKRLADMTVLDLSALWAGPLCGGLLAQAGMAVTKVESPARPDPTRQATPDQHARLNGAKRHMQMDLSDPALLDAIFAADVLITSARPHALARLGITQQALFARNPGLIWVAITAHGFFGDAAMRVGFGDDCAVAGGLVGWNDNVPCFLGDALADPLTGLRAARLVLDYVRSGQSGLLDAALAPTAATFAKAAGLR